MQPADAAFYERCRKYFDTWISAGHTYLKWKADFRPLARQLDKDLKAWYPSLIDCAQGQAHFEFRQRHRRPEVGRVELMPTRVVHAAAAIRFAELITDPLGALTGRCDRCEHCFIGRRRGSNKKFCSSKCAWETTAEKWRDYKRATVRADKIRRIEIAMQPMAAEEFSKPGWKRRLAASARVSQNFLTQSINKGKVRKVFVA